MHKKAIMRILFFVLALVIVSGLIPPTVVSAAPSVKILDGDARKFSDPPNLIAYANSNDYPSPPEMSITMGGTIWRYYQWIALQSQGSWVEANINVTTGNAGIQFWGDNNDGWARVLVDGAEVWKGNTYGTDNSYPGGAFVKYLEISGLTSGSHRITVENLGISGTVTSGADVTILFFGTKTAAAPSPAAPSSGLVAYYPFDSDYRDYSGNNNHGTARGSIPLVTASVGNGAWFDGKSWIEVNDSSSLDLYNTFTFSAWIYKDDSGTGGWSVILEKADSSATDDRSPYGFAHSQDGIYPTVSFAYNNRITNIYSNTGTNFKKWHLTTVTWDGTNVRFYLDGVLKDTKTWSNPLPNSTSKLLIGCGPIGLTEYFRGILDELRIYNRALSPVEIQALYEDGTGASLVSATTAPPTMTSIPPTPKPAATPTTPVSVQIPAPLASGLTFESRSKASGSSIQIPLTLKGTAARIGNVDLTLSYDPAVLRAGEALKGSLTSDSLFDFNVSAAGTIRISLADKAGFDGDGSVAYVVFDVIGQAGDSSPLRIASASANRLSDSASVPLSIQNGVFMVLGNEQLKGDFNGDGRLTPLDALAALQMAVGKRAEEAVMDVNNDGKVTSLDAQMILQNAIQSAAVSATTPAAAETNVPVVRFEMTGGYPTFDLPADTVSKVATPGEGAVIEIGTIKFVVPSGAVPKKTEVIVKEFKEPPPVTQGSASLAEAVAISRVYDVGPNGIRFEKPVLLTLRYDDSLLPTGADENRVRLAYYNGSGWILAAGLLDTVRNTVSIKTSEFPGNPVVIVYLIKLGIATSTAAVTWYAAYRQHSEPYDLGTAYKYVTPFDPTVEKYAGLIRVNGKVFHTQADLARALGSGGGAGRIQFDIGGRLTQATYKDPGNVWLTPAEWFNNGMTNGDCNEMANGYASILRAMGFKVKCVSGSTETGRASGQQHVWAEVEIDGKMYYIGEENDISPLESAQRNLKLQRGYMWDEAGQQPYKDKWWEEPAVAPPAPVAPAGRLVTATGTFTGLEALGYKPDFFSINTITLTFNSAGGAIKGTGQLYHKDIATIIDVRYEFDFGSYLPNQRDVKDTLVILKRYYKDFQSDGWETDKILPYWFRKSGDIEVKPGDIIVGQVDGWPGPFRLVVK